MSAFPLFEPSVPRIGRQRIFDRMCGDLTKPTPQHLSIVGPRYFGKTVMLDAVAKKMREDGGFECVISWDLGHSTPQSDDEFLKALREKIGDGLRKCSNDLAGYLGEDSGYDELREVIDALGKEKHRILMLWDGLDRPLREGKLTRNLWDNLLDLCRNDGLVLVTASRRKLQELIRDEKSVTSEFWQVFEVVRLTQMDEADIQAFAENVDGLEFQPGALAELGNWSGGIPPLLVGLLNRIHETGTSGTVSNKDVQEAASRIGEKAAGAMGIWAWQDCRRTTLCQPAG